jgi:hypothetical protein
LLEHLQDGTSDSISIIRKILDTSRCDIYYDLKHVREATLEHLDRRDKDLSARLAEYNVKDEDKPVIKYVAFEYRKWYIQELSNSLSWSNWVYYQVIDSPNDFYRSLCVPAIVGFCTGVYGRRAKFAVWPTYVASGVTASMASAADRCRKFYDNARRQKKP